MPWERSSSARKVDPSSGCTHVIRGKDESELMKNATEHAKTHGLRDVTPELQAKVRARCGTNSEAFPLRRAFPPLPALPSPETRKAIPVGTGIASLQLWLPRHDSNMRPGD